MPKSFCALKYRLEIRMWNVWVSRICLLQSLWKIQGEKIFKKQQWNNTLNSFTQLIELLNVEDKAEKHTYVGIKKYPSSDLYVAQIWAWEGGELVFTQVICLRVSVLLSDIKNQQWEICIDWRFTVQVKFQHFLCVAHETLS